MTIPASGVTGVQDAMLSPDRVLPNRDPIDGVDAMTGIVHIRP